jgi:micrococcal nuclease
VVVLAWLDRTVFVPGRVGQPAPRQQDPAQDIARYDGKTFTVTRVVDGDTLYINAPDTGDPATKVRLLGIDAPEMGAGGQEPMYYAREATEFVRRAVDGKAVTVYLDEVRTRDNYGRLLAYLELPDSRFLNDVLLLEGYVYADLRFRHSRYQRYQQFEAAARSLRKGLWAGVSREQLPGWLRRMQPDLLSGPQ